MTNPDAATRSLVIEREMPYPPEKIWRALTQGPLLEEWLMKNDFAPVAGHRFTFRATPMPNWNGVIDCEVLVVEPNKKLSYQLGVHGAGERRCLDADRDRRRNARAHGAIRLPSRSRAPPIRARNTAGRGSSATWNELSPGCNNAGIEKERS